MAERVSDISANLDNQLKKKVKSFVIFSVALDESTDMYRFYSLWWENKI